MQGITLASAKAVAAGKSCKQVDVSACANLGRKAVGEMLQTCKAASKVAESDDDRERYMSIALVVHPWGGLYRQFWLDDLKAGL